MSWLTRVAVVAGPMVVRALLAVVLTLLVGQGLLDADGAQACRAALGLSGSSSRPLALPQ